MKKLFLLLVASLSLGALLSMKGGYVFLTDKILDRSVKIIAFKKVHTPFGDFDGYAQGTGVSLGNGRILTEFHVVGGASRVVVLTRKRQQFDVAEIVRYAPTRDFAILSIEDKTLPATVIADKFEYGQSVIAVGNAGSQDFELAPARITGLGVVMLSSNSARTALQMDNRRIRHGFSGGGVFNKAGELVGMTEALGIEDAALAITGAEIKAYLGEKQ